MVECAKEFVSSPLRIAIGIVIGVISAVVTFSWNSSSAWSDVNSRIKEHESRLAKIEEAEDARGKEYMALREDIVTLQVQTKLLTESVKEVSRDVKDIRTMVK